MPTRYLIEMVCDRIAASKVYRGKDYQDGDALNYFLQGWKKSRLPRMHPRTAKRLYHILKMLADEGEEKTFEYIRRLK